MRLLKYDVDEKISLTEDFRGEIPSYAILSHTWGPDADEVTFQDLADGTGEDKAGYDKILFCRDQARRDGLLYFWIDTCCINKARDVELTEAINSMFRWYRDATKCYVFLSDVSSSLSWESAFRASRWFTRGWTLQELLAPASVQFFTREGIYLGDKTSLLQQIHEITNIAVPALQGYSPGPFDIEERFKWAKSRRTTRKEDRAYCLLGLFGVFMPVIYGEGREHAIRRLRKVINEAKFPEGRLKWILKWIKGNPCSTAFIILVICSIGLSIGVGVGVGIPRASSNAANATSTPTATPSATPTDLAGCPETNLQNITAYDGVNYTVHCNKNCVWGDLPNSNFSSPRLLDCVDLCSRNGSTCKGAAFTMSDSQPQWCWLKGSIDVTKLWNATDSGNAACAVKA